MVAIYKEKTKKMAGSPSLELELQRWDQEAQSLAWHQGTICFVEGGLPGERVKVKVTEHKSQFMKGQVQQVLHASPHRVKPQCQHAKACGGCQLHHVSAEHARTLKQQALEQHLQHHLKLDVIPWQPTLYGEALGYRRKARIGIWYDKKTNEFTVGFRRLAGKEITPIQQCIVLSPIIAPVFAVLQQALPKLTQGAAVTHVEVLDADGQAFVVVRHVKPLPSQDKLLLQQLWPEACWIGEAKPDQLEYWSGQAISPEYQVLPGVRLKFNPTDFIQVNANINQAMVAQALAWLQPDKSDKVLDLYCGIGNFSLALANKVAQVYGIEGVESMVNTARENAVLNQLDNAHFAQADLHLPWPKADWNQPQFQSIVLDPARAGALGAITEIARLRPGKVLYVSCNPTTFARDAKVLLDKGYHLEKISLMDMFPFTSHLELMALFTQTRQ